MQVNDLRALGALLRRFGTELEDLASGLEVQVARPPGSDVIDEVVASADSRDVRLVLDLGRRDVFWKGKRLERLTASEFALVAYLSARPAVVRSRSQILDEIMPEDLEAIDRCVDSRMKRIRKKFRAVDPDFRAIRTLHGIGYCWELEDE